MIDKNKNPLLLQRGFTLIELLVVIAIIGILSALLLPNLTGAQARARDGRRKSDLKAIATGLELYYNDHNYYPARGSGNGQFDFNHALTDSSSTPNTTYIKTPIPKDPKNSGGYEYYYCTQSTTPANNKKFNLFARLENPNDPDKCAITGTACPNATTNSCGTGSGGTAYSSSVLSTLNFTVSEP